MCLFEYDQEKHIKMEKAESYQDGIALGEERGKRLGQEMGQDIINRLNQSLIADNRLEDLTLQCSRSNISGRIVKRI